MIIDAHVHIGFNKVCSSTAAELLASMRRAKIDKALVFAGEINDCPTERMLEAIAPHAGKLHGIGSISPLSKKLPPLAKVEGWLKGGRIRGLKFYPGYEYFYPYDKAVRPYLKLLARLGRPAIFHSGDTYSRVHRAKLKYAQPIHVDDIATDLPELKIVIAHLGYPWIVDAAEVCYKNKNVYADCSGFVYGTFDAAHRAHFKELLAEFKRVAGAAGERMLFGTDWPIGDQASYVAAVRPMLGKNAEKILWKNAAALFGLNEA